MQMRSAVIRLAVVSIALCAGGTLAHADAIDGNWCSAEGRHISIAGPLITTPGGAHISGDYSRHAFSYVAPSGEEGAGAAVLMRLMNEEEVRVSFPSQVPVIWHRCKLETS